MAVPPNVAGRSPERREPTLLLQSKGVCSAMRKSRRRELRSVLMDEGAQRLVSGNGARGRVARLVDMA